MQPLKTFLLKLSPLAICAVLLCISSTNVCAQTLRPDDKIDAETAKNRKDQFKGSYNANKKFPNMVKFSVSELKEILNTFRNVDSVEFHFAVIRLEDVDRYSKKAKVADKEKNLLVQKPTMLIKAAMASAGLKGVVAGNAFYDCAVICPPPSGSCD